MTRPARVGGAMFPQPQPGDYHDGFNERLLGAVPSRADRILEVGCARGRLGHQLKRQDPGRYVAGVELDPDAARAARQRERMGQLEGELASTRDQLADRSRHIANMEASAFWRLRTVVHRLLRR